MGRHGTLKSERPWPLYLHLLHYFDKQLSVIRLHLRQTTSRPLGLNAQQMRKSDLSQSLPPPQPGKVVPGGERAAHKAENQITRAAK